MPARREAYLSVTEYRKQIESDSSSFFRNDSELMRASPVPHPTKPNKIVFYSGAMASCFPMVSGANKWGVKLFFQKIPDLEVRYEEINATLKNLKSPHFIALEYREGPRNGALWSSEYTPYIKMEYVEGAVLREHVGKLAVKRDARAFRDLAQQWRKIALMMEQEQIAHGDIQAENLKVTNAGIIRLIDLDTMFVPSLRPRKLKCVAYGIPSWQHPQKKTDEFHFDERLDRFPALTMYLCLLALSDNPSLFDPQAVGENELLFTKDDLLDPSSSRIFRDLSNSANPEVRRVTEALAKAAVGPYDDIPAFSKVADPDAEAKEALAALKNAIQSKDHRRVRDAWIPILDTYAPAQPLRPEITFAREHLEKLVRFSNAAAADDDRILAQIWQTPPNLEQCCCSKNERIASGTSIADRAARAIRCVRGIEVLRCVIAASDQKKADSGLFQLAEESTIVEKWSDPQYDFTGSKAAKELFQKRVDESVKRLATAEYFDTIIATDDDEGIAKAWEILAIFAPSTTHQQRAEAAAARMKVLSDFLNQLRQESEDEVLWNTWTRRADMGKCKPALRPRPQLGGLVPAQRASLAGKRVEALVELKKAFAQYDVQTPEEQSERAILAAWESHRVILGPARAAATYRMRADEAQKRLKAWEEFQKGIRADDDESIATAYQSGLLKNFAPARSHFERAMVGVERMAVIAKLWQRQKENPEDEDGLIRIAELRQDMEKCRSFLQPSSVLADKCWKERLQVAVRLLWIRSEISQTLAAIPIKYDQLVKIWDEKLCRSHRLFAPDLNRIDDARELGTRLLELRQGLDAGNDSTISGAWREEFRALMRQNELDTIREAMRNQFTGPTSIGGLEFSLAPDDLVVRWDWRGPAKFCLLEVADGRFPDAPAKARPNAFRGEVAGGVLNIPFTGRTPHLRAWVMFRFLDEFLLGASPIEKRMETVKYCVTKPLLRRHCLQLHTLSAKVALPSLIVSISDSLLWQKSEEIQRLPDMVVCGCITLELSLPRFLSKGNEHYLSLRPVQKKDEAWLRLVPQSSEATVIRL